MNSQASSSVNTAPQTVSNSNEIIVKDSDLLKILKKVKNFETGFYLHTHEWETVKNNHVKKIFSDLQKKRYKDNDVVEVYNTYRIFLNRRTEECDKAVESVFTKKTPSDKLIKALIGKNPFTSKITISLPYSKKISKITDAGIRIIGSLPCLQSFTISSLNEELGLSKITDKSISTLTGLEVLALEGSLNITERAVTAIVQACSLKKFTLDTKNAISDQLIRELAKNNQLEELYLRDCDRITDESIKNIANLQNLKKLSLMNAIHITFKAWTNLFMRTSAEELFLDKIWLTDAVFADFPPDFESNLKVLNIKCRSNFTGITNNAIKKHFPKIKDF